MESLLGDNHSKRQRVKATILLLEDLFNQQDGEIQGLMKKGGVLVVAIVLSSKGSEGKRGQEKKQLTVLIERNHFRGF